MSLLWRSLLLLLLAVPAWAADPAVKAPKGYQLVYSNDFKSAAGLKDFAFTDPMAWTWVAKTNAMALVTQSHYEPPFRSPFNIALLREKAAGDFVLEAELLQTSKEYGHRDMVLCFGFQDAAHFYYAHIATAADDHAHNIFVVNGSPRIKIAKETTKGVDWGQGVWHKVRLERVVATGIIKVFYDDLTKPIMTAEDKTFGAGRIGFGSFDDTGMVKNIRLWSPQAGKAEGNPFERVAPIRK
jgi:hypothetical protein